MKYETIYTDYAPSVPEVRIAVWKTRAEAEACKQRTLRFLSTLTALSDKPGVSVRRITEGRDAA